MWAENEPQDEGKYAFINGETRVGPLEKRYAHLEPEQSKPTLEILVVPELQRNVNNNPEETQNLVFSSIAPKNTLFGDKKPSKRDGPGEYTWANGDKYDGEFKNNKLNGKGTYLYTNGNKYFGEFLNGELSGFGEYTKNTGAKYVGQFKNSRKEGFGKYYYTNGYLYDGQFKSNKPHGTGKIFGKDGAVVYSGEFKSNKKHGKGELIIGDSIGHKYFFFLKI